MQAAGIDSGMSKSSSTVSGYSGSWSEQSSNYSNINKTGILGYRVGYDSAMYSVFLRRDGTLPMIGDLDMGAQNIKNAKNITVSGTGNFGGEVVAHNGTGDAITLGGDSAGGTASDYELRLGTGKQLTIYSPNAASYSTTLRVNRNTIVDQRLSTNGLDPNDIPAGCAGGVRAFDVIASGTVALIKSGTSALAGNLAAYMNLNGDIYASNSVNSSGTVTAAGSPVIRTASASAYRFPGAVASCVGSEKVIGGGGQCTTSQGFIWLATSRPNGDNGWYATCDSTQNLTGYITVYAICQ